MVLVHHAVHVLISTRTPLAGSDVLLHLGFSTVDISTRTPLAGSDIVEALLQEWNERFQPALPLRGVTTDKERAYVANDVFQPALPLRGVTPLRSFS